MIDIKPFVPQEVCLQCDGCCRYAARDTVWAPLFFFSEIRELTQKDIVPSCVFSHEAPVGRQAARIDLVGEGDAWFCPCFDRPTSCCKIYSHRPFDCRIYPFVLARHCGRAALAVDGKCPYVRERLNTKVFKDYCRYLLDVLDGPFFRRLARQNPQVFQTYPGDIQILAYLPDAPPLL